MSLITIDDDSSSNEMVIVSIPGDTNDADTKENDDISDSKSTDSDINIIKDINEGSSNDKSDDSDNFQPSSVDEGPSTSGTVQTAETDNETQEKPILELMKHLINYNGKQNTPLTDAALVKMLKDEFGIDVANLPLISVNIYMNVLKKFLKDWPQWDEFDRVVHESRCMNDDEEIEKMLDREYNALKEYLAAMLKACRPWAREAAQKVKRSLEIPESARGVPGDVILEINCSRDQLNRLFFRKPHPDFNNTIFNVEPSLPSRITLSTLTLKSVLNSCYVTLTLNLNCFKFKRELVHVLKHTLINKKNHQHTQDTKLNSWVQVPKLTVKKEYIVSKKDIKSMTDKVLNCNTYSEEERRNIKTIFQIINDDVSVIEKDFKVPSSFRHYMNPYSYVRYLYEDVNTESDKYDLQLEEKLSPRLIFHVTRVNFKVSAVNNDPGWLKLECTFCKLAFFGFEGIEQLKNHFRDEHQNEPDFTCTNCDKTFSVNALAEMRWYHKCSEPHIYDSDSQ